MSLLWHIATHLARGAFKVPVIPVEITTEDVPPYVPREKGPDECARSACKNTVQWPQIWCSDSCHQVWSREHWRLTA